MILGYNTQFNLYEYIFHCGSINFNISHINPKVIKEIILDDYKHAGLELAAYKDFKPTHIKHIGWVFDYIKDHHKNNKGKINKWLGPKMFFANVENKGESYPLRHTFDYEDVKNTPHMTVMYFVTGGGQLILKHPSFEKEEEFSELDIKDNMFVVFNSKIHYLRTPNPNDEPRISMTWACEYL